MRQTRGESGVGGAIETHGHVSYLSFRMKVAGGEMALLASCLETPGSPGPRLLAGASAPAEAQREPLWFRRGCCLGASPGPLTEHFPGLHGHDTSVIRNGSPATQPFCGDQTC